ncbi:MAG: SUMF1/EgtB/PvdO family nonheme iron enzyme [Flavobacteriales bacterium]|nr:SUMF1/EgtB/PvdO family nonheme iron enzyme [Flavobacteriales bacterium]
MRNVLLFTLLAFALSTVLAQRPFQIAGMVQVDDSTFIDTKEVSLADWISYTMTERGSGRPAEEVLQQLPFRYIFVDPPYPARYRNAPTVATRNGWMTLKLDADSLRTRDQRYRTKLYLDYPIVGITNLQARAYCDQLTEQRLAELEWDDEGDGPEVIYSLPSPELYDRLLSPRDSTNGKCALFNYSCEPCQSQPEGRDAFIHPGREITPVDGYTPDWRGLYNLRGNTAEMTTVPGVAKGGSYAHPAKASLPGQEQHYSAPQAWLGFRCVAHVRPH